MVVVVYWINRVEIQCTNMEIIPAKQLQTRNLSRHSWVSWTSRYDHDDIQGWVRCVLWQMEVNISQKNSNQFSTQSFRSIKGLQASRRDSRQISIRDANNKSPSLCGYLRSSVFHKNSSRCYLLMNLRCLLSQDITV